MIKRATMKNVKARSFVELGVDNFPEANELIKRLAMADPNSETVDIMLRMKDTFKRLGTLKEATGKALYQSQESNEERKEQYKQE